MKKQIYNLSCGLCGGDFFDGTIQEIHSYIKSEFHLEPEDINEVFEDEKTIDITCTECSRFLS
jgi:hypothetical protein